MSFLKMFVRWNSLLSCPLEWNVDRLDLRKNPISSPILSTFKLIILCSYRLELFGQCLHGDEF